MGWKTPPGSTAQIVQQWTSATKTLGVVFLWLSVFHSIIFIFALYAALKPERQWLIPLPLAFGAGAGFTAESLRRDTVPSTRKWALTLFFAFPPLSRMAGDAGLFEAARWLVQIVNGG